MLQTATVAPARRTLEFGIYRDGDNNLDAIQEATLSQALQTSRSDARIEFTVEDTTSLHGGDLHTDEYTIAGGSIGHVRREDAQTMSDEDTLARFVAHTLDDAESSGVKQTWIDLVDHGGGDGGGLQTSDGRCMPMPAIAQAVADGIALHAREHPEDAGRGVDGVVANQCLMDTMGFAEGYYIRAFKLPVGRPAYWSRCRRNLSRRSLHVVSTARTPPEVRTIRFL